MAQAPPASSISSPNPPGSCVPAVKCGSVWCADEPTTPSIESRKVREGLRTRVGRAASPGSASLSPSAPADAKVEEEEWESGVSGEAGPLESGVGTRMGGGAGGRDEVEGAGTVFADVVFVVIGAVRGSLLGMRMFCSPSSCGAVPKYTFRSTVTLRLAGKYTRCA